jgi:hypothetical protein
MTGHGCGSSGMTLWGASVRGILKGILKGFVREVADEYSFVTSNIRSYFKGQVLHGNQRMFTKFGRQSQISFDFLRGTVPIFEGQT